MSKRYHTKTKRKQLCERYLESGQTQKQFSAEQGISSKTLSRWLNAGENKKAKPLKFLPVGEIKPLIGLAEIILPNAIKIRLQIEVEKLSTIAQGLLSCK